jgi:hypothetical protein
MKIWHGHGSEHSARLVMIGRFSGPEQARATEQRFKRLQDIAEHSLPERDWEDPDERLTDELSQELVQMRLYQFTRDDVENFRYDHSVTRDGDELHLGTDELDILGFVKLMLSDGAKLEIYSRDSWTKDGPAGNQADEASPAGSGAPDEE